MYDDDSLIRLSRKAASLMGITWILADSSYLLLPAEQRQASPGLLFLPSVSLDYSFLLFIRKLNNRLRSVNKKLGAMGKHSVDVVRYATT